MNRSKTLIKREQFPEPERDLVTRLNRLNLMFWGDLDGRCACALAPFVSDSGMRVLYDVGHEHGAMVIDHEYHETLRGHLEAAPHPKDLELQARVSRADCPILYGPQAGETVLVPRDLVSNWDQPEAYWWRRGVDAAFETARDFV